MAECREKHYPYPDECVFLVTGHRPNSNPSSTASMTIVSRTAERASQFFMSMSDDVQKWKVIGCVSLDQLKGLRSRMTQSRAGQVFKELKSGLLGSVLGHRQPWAVAFLNEMDQPTEPEIVMARTSSDVRAYIESTGKNSTGMFALDALEETIDQLEQVQIGKSKSERYAIDYAGGELAQEFAEVRAKRSPEEQTNVDAIVARALRKQAAGILR